MKQWITIICWLLLSTVNGQKKNPASNLVAIDHVPVVVRSLDSIQQLLTDVLHFTIKPGREHEGIKNFFIKFEDGTYLEFITPVDSRFSIGKYYNDFLKRRQGGTRLAVSVHESDWVISMLKNKSIAFDTTSNRIWRTVVPKNAGLFFIEYRNKKWKDSRQNTTHKNGALALKSTYLLSTAPNADAGNYEHFGFKQVNTGLFQQVPFHLLKAGSNNLYMLEKAKAGKLTAGFNNSDITGICGFEIKVRSLEKINQLLAGAANALIDNDMTIYFLNDYNFFIVFSR